MIKKEYIVLFAFYSFFYVLANTDQHSTHEDPVSHVYSMPIRFPEDNTLFIYTWDNTETDLQCFPQHALDDFHENLKEYIWTATEIEKLELNKPTKAFFASLVTDVNYHVELVRPDTDHLKITFLSIQSNGPLYLIGSDYAIDESRVGQFDTWQDLVRKNIINPNVVTDIHGLREEIWDSQRQWWDWVQQNIVKNTGTQGGTPNVYKRTYNSDEAKKFGNTQLIQFGK